MISRNGAPVMRAWQAILASFLFFAPSANAKTIQIVDDPGGFSPHINALGHARSGKGKCTNCRPLRLRVHYSARLYSARTNLRKFQGVSRVSFGHSRVCHAGFMESVSFGHPVVDCAARRSNSSNYLVTSSGYIRIFSQVLIVRWFTADTGRANL